MKNFLSLQNISLDLDNKEILKGLNLQVDKGEFIAITGSSGAGKTSLLRIICGLESPKEGEILLDNMIIFNKGISVPTEKRNIGLVIQEKVLFPHLTARKNIEFGLSKNSSNESHVDEILHHLNITKLANKFPHELSGGESQRVALARSIVMKPKLLLLDEPFTGLDTELKSNIYPEIQSILKNNMITSLMVTHDLNEVKALSDKCFNLDSGRLIEI
ncbi:MAG: ABC transporter [Gammaproteobacteria bacterium]|nr:ABC transporter [Gammaproteobacteria bacterium]